MPVTNPSQLTFSSSAENIAGTIENKSVDPLGLREALNSTGTAPIYACRAWVNFNGTGTVAIRASGNVSSITDNGVGMFTINFANAMPDANYVISGSVGGVTGDGTWRTYEDISARTVSSIKIATAYLSTLTDYPQCNFAIHR